MLVSHWPAQMVRAYLLQTTSLSVVLQVAWESGSHFPDLYPGASSRVLGDKAPELLQILATWAALFEIKGNNFCIRS